MKYYLLIAFLFLSCSKEGVQNQSSVKFRMPTKAQLTGHQYQGIKSSGVNSLASYEDISCFAIFAQSSEEKALGKCFDANSGEVASRPFHFKGYIGLGEEVEIVVPVGNKRLFQVLAVNSDLGCFGLEDYQGSFSAKTSNPKIVAQKEVNLVAGTQVVDIDIELENSIELSHCDFFTRANGGEITSVSLENDQLKIYGNFEGVSAVHLDETPLSIISKSTSEIIASVNPAILLTLDKALNLIIDSASGQSSVNVQFGLVNGSITADMLGPMGAVIGDVLRFDGTNWIPTSLGGLSLQGGWDPTVNAQGLADGTGSGGEYYIAASAGTIDLGSGAISYAVGDWVVYDANLNQWFKVENGASVHSFNGRTGSITPMPNDYTWAQIDKTASSLEDISNVSNTAAATGDVLKWDGSNWSPAVDNASAGGGDFKADGSVAMTGNIDVGGMDINNVGLVDGYDLATLPTTLATLEPMITPGAATDYIRGDKTLAPFAATVVSTTLTGFTVGSNTAIIATDSIQGALEKTQAQLNNILANAGDFMADGSVPMTGNLTLGTYDLLVSNGLGNPGEILYKDASGLKWSLPAWDFDGTNAGFNGLNVGIGTFFPAYLLDVQSSANVAGRFRGTDSAQNPAGIRLENTNSASAGWIVGELDDQSFAIKANGVGTHFFIDNGGNVGIGEPSGGDLLEVTKNGVTHAARFKGNSAGPFGITIQNLAGSGQWDFFHDSTDGNSLVIANTGSPTFKVSPGGDFDITGNLTVAGAVAGGSAYINASDERFKEDIEVIDNALFKVLELKGMNFLWRQSEFPQYNFKEGRDIGLIAQNVERVFPEAVYEQEDGYKGVAYSNLVAPIIEAMKEFFHKFSTHKQSVDKRVEALEKENKLLRASLCEIRKSLEICQ